MTAALRRLTLDRMTDTACLELLTSYEVALEAAQRSVTIARELADGLLNGRHPPDNVVRVYAEQIDRDAAQLAELREKVEEFKSWFRTH